MNECPEERNILDMKRYVEVYKQCMYSAVQTASAYRMNFIVSSLITLIGNILFPLVTLLIYRAGTSFPAGAYTRSC